MPSKFRVDVVNPWGRDAPVDWQGGLTPPEAPGHPPINYWAWAAATRGRFHKMPDTVEGDADAVVVLLRWRGLTNLRAVRQLKARGLRVFVSWKESGAAQIEKQLRWPWRRSALRKVLKIADGAIATTEPGLAHYREYGLPAERVHFIPTPYPFDQPGWDFALPLPERSGILVGSRQFDVAARRHAEALTLAGRVARAAGCGVTVFNLDGEAGRAHVTALLGEVRALRWIERRLAYPDYLREMARHRIVVQRDAGWVPGQVAGDALLCGLVNVGGNGAVQRLAFSQTSEPEHHTEALFESASKLLTDDAHYLLEAREARTLAHTAGLSFESSRRLLTQRLTAF